MKTLGETWEASAVSETRPGVAGKTESEKHLKRLNWEGAREGELRETVFRFSIHYNIHFIPTGGRRPKGGLSSRSHVFPF
jgi:hypothetical protein